MTFEGYGDGILDIDFRLDAFDVIETFFAHYFPGGERAAGNLIHDRRPSLENRRAPGLIEREQGQKESNGPLCRFADAMPRLGVRSAGREQPRIGPGEGPPLIETEFETRKRL